MRFLAAIESMAPSFDQLDALTCEVSDGAERRQLRHLVGKAMLLVDYDLVMHVVRQYPDLDPDGERFRRPLSTHEN